MFTSDDLVVYPAQGVGKIERIDSKTVGGIVCELYIVRIRANNVTLMVPVNNAAHVGLRTLTPKDEALTILESLRNESGKAVYELDEGAHHDHMVCMICGRVTEFFSPEIEELQTRIAEQHNFRIREHSLYLYGECTDCNCAGKTLGKPRL